MAEITGICAQPHTCVVCACTFNPKRTDRTTCCSRACGYVLQRQRGAASRELTTRAEAAAWQQREEARRETMQATADRHSQARAIQMEQHSSRRCAVCGGLNGYHFGRPRRYCSPGCYSAAEVQVVNKRRAKATRKARERTATVEAFDPVEVLRRDGWRCHLCGSKTPERLRGTMAARAPELDHIVPLAKGGAHTRANTACACRRCNGLKGDRLIGQLRLVG